MENFKLTFFCTGYFLAQILNLIRFDHGNLKEIAGCLVGFLLVASADFVGYMGKGLIESIEELDSEDDNEEVN